MISAVSQNTFKTSFTEAKPKGDAQNPISKNGERALALKTAAVAGLGVGARALWYLFEDGFVFEDLWNVGKKVVDKNVKNGVNGSADKYLKKGLKEGGNKQLKYIAAFLAVTGGFIAAVAALYTIYKVPNIEYNAKVNSFVKGKDMDVYIKGNEVETELYDQMNDAAKNATEEDKVKLREQYLKLRAAKNQLPEWALQK